MFSPAPWWFGLLDFCMSFVDEFSSGIATS